MLQVAVLHELILQFFIRDVDMLLSNFGLRQPIKVRQSSGTRQKDLDVKIRAYLVHLSLALILKTK